MSDKDLKNHFEVVDSQGDLVEGLVVKKMPGNFQLFQDGYYAGTLNVDKACALNLVPYQSKPKS